MMNNLEIPVIEIGDLITSDIHSNSPIVSAIKDALQNIGFFYISNHGLSIEELQKGLELSKRFFQLPPEEKSKLSKPQGVNALGYMATGVENADDSNPNLIDLKEAINFSVHEPHPYYTPNAWPPESVLPHWKEELKELGEKLEMIARRIVVAFALAMGEEGDFLSKWFNPLSYSVLRLLRYPPTPLEGGIGCGAHSDYGLSTLLIQDSIGGLQILYKGEWIDATPIPGTIVVNVGDCMEYLTNGAFKATKHRVINKSHSLERHVCLVFCEPDYKMPMKVAEAFKDRTPLTIWERTPTFGEHLTRRLGATYTY
uniref:Fe2OG dioxygenase domain-containing protein n=1 Tax=Arcella intermedia TaxID=1963864 RepID=A0A6B2LAM6_9EUKA